MSVSPTSLTKLTRGSQSALDAPRVAGGQCPRHESNMRTRFRKAVLIAAVSRRKCLRDRCAGHSAGSWETQGGARGPSRPFRVPRVHLSSLSMSNYRGFVSAEVALPAAGVVLVVGPNNAGKSALLAALDVVAAVKPRERMAREGATELPRIQATFTLTEAERLLLFDEVAEQDLEVRDRWPAPWFQGWRLSFSAADPQTAFTSAVEISRGDQPGVFEVLAHQQSGPQGFAWDRRPICQCGWLEP